MVILNWTKIRNEYISGNISYRKLADKHRIPYQTLRDRATKEGWFEKRKIQRDKINLKTEQKTAEKIAEIESDLAADIHSAATELLKKLTIAIEQTDLFIEKTKTKVPTKVKDKDGRVYDAYREEENIKLSKKNGINISSVKQLASALKDLQSIQMSGKEEATQESPNINISIVAATPIDEEDEGDEE